MSPPCGTWSRVRFQWQLHPGPRPQRNRSWPWGFPWLSAARRKNVDLANFFVSQTIQAAQLAHSVGTCFLIEHPEDLGSVNGEHPASIWQLDETRDLQASTNATTWAIFQCVFGADTSKPTRFLSTIPGIKSRYAKWPSFDSDGKYVGPLPCRCPHKRHVRRLIGKDAQGRWVTGPAAAYPAGLCKYLASLVVSVLRKGGNHKTVQQQPPPSPQVRMEVDDGATNSKQLPGEDNSNLATQTPAEPVLGGAGQKLGEMPAAVASESGKAFDELHTVSKFNWGRPMMVEWSGEERDLVCARRIGGILRAGDMVRALWLLR
eukprot:s3778_g10.t1